MGMDNLRGIGGIRGRISRCGMLLRQMPEQRLLHIAGVLEAVFGFHVKCAIHCRQEGTAVLPFVTAACKLGLGIGFGNAGGGFFHQLVGYRLIDARA